MWKKILLGIGAIILIGVIAMVGMLKSTQKALDSIAISEVNLAAIPNGQYVGEYDAKAVYAKVRVTVQDHVIKAIDILEHRNGRGAAGEKVTANIIAQQSLLVDSISGATYSSRVITKAAEVSLRGAKK